MAFDKGKINFGMLVSPTPLDETFDDTLMSMAYREDQPDVDTPIIDITSGVSIDNDTPDTSDLEFMTTGGHLYGAVRKREKKIDKKLYKEKVEKAIHRKLLNTGQEYLSRTQKKEIKQDIMEMMVLEATVQYTGIRFVVSGDRRTVFVEATSAKKVEEVFEQLYVLNCPLEIYSLDHLVRRENGEDADVEAFLTWLWMASETDGVLPPEFQVALTGNIVLENPDTEIGAKTIRISNGSPALAKEAWAALREGKNVKAAEFSLAITASSRVFEATITTEGCFKSFREKSLEVKGLDRHSAFAERIKSCKDFVEVFENIFEAYRKSPAADVERTIEQWVNSRVVEATA
jgi:hypothetical protein